MKDHIALAAIMSLFSIAAAAQTGCPAPGQLNCPTTIPTVNPLVVPAVQAWIPGTAYVPGQIVTNHGNAYTAYLGGTSASFGGPSGTGPDRIADGSVYWYFYGTGPTITNLPGFQPDPPDLTQSVLNSSNAANPAFTYTGGTPYVYSPHQSGTDWIFPSGKEDANGDYIYSDISMSFVSDAPKVELIGYTPYPYRLLIDGQYAFAGGGTMQLSTNDEGRVVVSWNSVSQAHQYTLVENGAQSAAWFAGVKVGVNSSGKAYSVTPLPAGTRACFLGDSTVSGVNETSAPNYPYPLIFPYLSGETWPWQVGQQLGWTDVWNMGIRGNGYLQGYTLDKQVPDIAQNACKVVLIEAGHNDLIGTADANNNNNPITAAQLQAAVATVLSDIRNGLANKGLPNVPIIVFGMWPGAEGASYPPNSAQYLTESAIHAGVTQVNDPNTYFIPLVTDPAGSWLTGYGTTNAPNGTGNSDFYISGDATHPVQAGIDYMASKATTAIKAILPNLKGLE